MTAVWSDQKLGFLACAEHTLALGGAGLWQDARRVDESAG